MTEQQLAAMRQALEACPFCGGDAEYRKENVRSGYGEYEYNETYHTIRCKKCGSSSKRVHQKHLIDFTKYTVRDFRENPILRAKVEDDYDAYCEQSKQLAVDAWNLRTAIEAETAQGQEPLALERVYETIIHWNEGGGKRSRRELARRIVDLYTTPPAAQRQWAGLTDEDVIDLRSKYQSGHIGSFVDLIVQTATKLKEKNHG
jgi:hypothetical protein